MTRKMRAPKSSGDNERCVRCGEPADWEVTGHTILPRREVTRGNKKVVEQPFNLYYLCDLHAQREVTGDHPPRGRVALPHHQRRMKAQEHAALAELIGHAEQPRLGDWGRP